MESTAGDSFPGVIPPPPGQTANFVNPESIAVRLIIACVLGPVLSLVLLLLRLYTAWRVAQRVRVDDCESRFEPDLCGALRMPNSVLGLIVFAWIFATGYAVISGIRECPWSDCRSSDGANMAAVTRSGMGFHLWEVTPGQVRQLLIVSISPGFA